MIYKENIEFLIYSGIQEEEWQIINSINVRKLFYQFIYTLGERVGRLLDKLIKRFNINIYSMLKHGSVAVITLFGVGILFGMKNVMIAFPIALTSTVLGRQNFQVKTFSKASRIVLIDLIIVLTSHISSINIILGIPINFIAIFLIMYTMVSPYDLTFYKPFIMLYVFTQYAKVPVGELYLRLLAVIFGVLIVVFASFINKVNEKSVLGKNITRSFEIIKKQLGNILEGAYDLKVEENCSKIMRDIAYKIYVTRYRRYLTTNLGRIQFKLFINIEHFNLYIREIHNKLIKKEIGIVEIEELSEVIENIIDFSKDIMTLEELEKNVERYVYRYKGKSHYGNEIIDILERILKNIKDLAYIGSKEINKVYKKWEKSDIDKYRVTFKEYFKPNTIRFKFAMRMAITLTAALLVAELLGFYKVIWAVITIMSIMQPYYEDTITKTKERVVGNVIAIAFTTVVINIVNIRWVTITILVASLYLIYAFKEYYRISLFAAVASICIASLTENINVLIFYRVIYVIIGAIIVIIVNKLILPYRLKDGIEQLVAKISKLNKRLIDASMDFLDGNNDIHEIRDIIIHSTLLGQKLYLRNLQYNDEGINRFININNNYVIEVGYKVLIYKGKNDEIKDENIEEIGRLYKAFSEGVKTL
ncbi:FUSC family protein [Clostridium sp.]|uniref:FUSC family protein n=1 Tax=Clostridium sp. TaxID=1506 RepID=UPI0032167C41